MGAGGEDRHLAECQEKSFASAEASLERDTRKTLAEWAARGDRRPSDMDGPA
ncbi:hypothetical protein MCEMIH16_00241 [Caulobacteraceae bacterium]